MQLDVRYVIADNPAQQVVPERQVTLNRIPTPDLIDHPGITPALVSYSDALAQEKEIRVALAQAERDLPATELRDQEALADAQAAGKKDPGPVHVRKQEALIADLKRRYGAANITLQRSVDAVRVAFEQHGDDWHATLEMEGEAIRDQMGLALDEFSALHRRLQLNMAHRAVGGSAPRAAASFVATIWTERAGNTSHVAEVVAALRTLGQPPEPNAGVVENVDPTVRVVGGVRVVDHKARIREWGEREYAAAQATASLLPSREERLARAEEKRQARETRRAIEKDAFDSVA